MRATLVVCAYAVLSLLAWAVFADIPVLTTPVGLLTTNDVVRQAAAHISRLDPDSQKAALYISFHAHPLRLRARRIQALGHVVNSISLSGRIIAPVAVPDTCNVLVYIDIRDLQFDRRKLDPKFAAVFDQLGEQGSGPAPFPEPYFHYIKEVVVDEPARKVPYEAPVYERYSTGEIALYYDPRLGHRDKDEAWKPRVIGSITKYRETPGKREVNRVVTFGPGVDEATAIGFVKLTGSSFRIFEAKWFTTFALLEPIYPQWLGLDDTLASVQKLARVDLKGSDDDGVTTRGAILFSEVASRNRAAERTPTRWRFGRGAYYQTFDFLTSLNASDVLSDLLVRKSDAAEIIWTIPNGLHGYSIFDGKGKRLPKANEDVAQNSRRVSSRLKDHSVRTALSCLWCHLAEDGIIEIGDEVAEFGKKTVNLFVSRHFRDEADRGRRVRERYLAINWNELAQADQKDFLQCVRAATRGLTCAEVNKELEDMVYEAIVRPVTIETLAWDVGYPPAKVLRALETPGIANALVGVRLGRPARPDQKDAALGQLLQLLYAME